ncbi:hypothetical protein Tco_0667035, partial [Tanacetum coccineum]
MANLNIPVEQAPAVAPPTRTDDQILPAFTTSSTIPAIYIQQFWDTMCFNSSTGLYSCQLDEQWFNLHKDILRDALNITPANDNNPFVAPPSSDTVIKYVNTLGYPSTLKNVSAMYVNALYQPWRAILSMFNMCLTGKTARFDRPRHPVLQILWGIIHRSNIYYAERIWEEFVQSIQTFLTDRKNLATAARGKKKAAHLLIPSVRFTKLIIHYLRTKHNIHLRTGSPLHYSHEESILNTLRFIGKDGREIFGMPIPDALLTDEIKGAPYYGDYQEHVAKYQQFLDEERSKAKKGGATKSSEASKVTKPKAAKAIKPAGDKAPKPTATQPPKPKPAPTQPSKVVSKKKRNLVKETPDEPSSAKRSKGGLEPAYNEEDANLQRDLELSLMEQGAQTQGPARPVVIREPESGRIQPLLEEQRKGKEKVSDEQAAHDLLTLQTPQKKSLADQFIFQRCPPMPTESSTHAESPSIDAELNLTKSEIESDEEASKINVGNQEGQAGPNPGIQDEGQTGPNPGEQDEGQARPNPGIAAESQLQTSHVVHAGPNLDRMDLGTSDALTQQKPEQMDEDSTGTLSSLQNLDKDLSFTDQFFMENPHEEESGKTNAETEVQLMVSVPIHQDTSSVPSMTTSVIDLTSMQSDSPIPTSTTTTSIIITTTTLPLPPPQSTIDPILVHRIGELEQYITDLVQNNLALEERLEKHRSRLYKLENLNIPYQVNKSVDEIVADAVDWAMQVPLRACFRDLPTVDMKEIIQQRMLKDDSYKAHTVHNDLYKALHKSLELDYSNQRLADQEEARKKRRKKRDVPRTPPGSPPSQLPPPPPSAGVSGALGNSRASGSSQLPPPPPPPSTGTSGSAQQQGNKAPSS